MKVIEKPPYKVVVEDLTKQILYDGSQIVNHYTTEKYGIFGDSILIFRGGMKLSPNEMVDIKDVKRESHLADILISSDDTLHFIVEEFDTQPPNMELEYYRLRLFAQSVIDSLKEKGIEIQKNGTDLYHGERKLNVGIASTGISSSKIHFGLNITSFGVPSHVNAIGLSELGIEEDSILDLAIKIAEKYINEIIDIKEDVAKTKPL